jgi:hypothetical protein
MASRESTPHDYLLESTRALSGMKLPTAYTLAEVIPTDGQTKTTVKCCSHVAIDASQNLLDFYNGAV